MTEITSLPDQPVFAPPRHPRLAWLWGGNPFYIASAGCILAGLWQILAAVYQRPELSIEKFFALTALNGYELVLLGVTILILAWRNVVDDAVALTVIIALFLVGASIALDAVAPDFAVAVFRLGLAGLLLAGVKLYCLNRFIIGRFTALQLAGLAILMASNMLMPAVLGRVLTNATQHDLMRHTADPQLRHGWLAGWWAALIGVSLLVAAAARVRNGWASAGDPGQPFLHTSVMRWIVVAIVAVGSLIHQWGLFWSFGVPLEMGDLLPGLAVLCLLAIEVLRAYGRDRRWTDALVALLPAGACALALHARAYTFAPEWSWGVICYPPVTVLVLGIALLALGVRGRRLRLHAIGLAYLVMATLTMGAASPHGPVSVAIAKDSVDLAANRPGWVLISLSFLMLGCGMAASLFKRGPGGQHGAGSSDAAIHPAPSGAAPAAPPQ